MENEDLVGVSQVNDEFTLISLFFRADIVVKLVILILFACIDLVGPSTVYHLKL